MMNNAYKDLETKPADHFVIGDKNGVRTLAKYEPANTNRYRPAEPVQAQQPITLDITPTATQHVEMRTSAVDRAEGFLKSTVPLFAAFAFAVTTLAIVTTGITLVSAFVLYWCIFAMTWLIAYIATLLISAEGTAFVESWRKWNVISREQRNRWDHYKGG